MTQEQTQAIKCAFADLLGSAEARNEGSLEIHDWEGHRQTIKDLLSAFPFLQENDLTSEQTLLNV